MPSQAKSPTAKNTPIALGSTFVQRICKSRIRQYLCRDNICTLRQFIAKDFKQFVRLNGMTHVRTSPYYPQSNGKMERWHQSAKTECIRPQTPQSLEEALRIVTKYVEHYNTVRLHSAIGYVTPKDKLDGRAEQILAARDAKLEAARQARRTATVAQTN